MKRLVVFAMLSVLPFFSCNNDDNSVPEIKEAKPIVLNTTEKAIATEQNDFATSLFTTLNKEFDTAENLLISPFSLQCALGMVTNGAVGETKEEIIQAMGLEGYSQDEVNDYFQKLIEGLNYVNANISVHTANSIWGNKDYTLKEEFRQTNIEKYSAMVATLDFSDPASVDKINDWCNETTEGLIPGVLDELSPSATVYLLNSLYFKARWSDEFSKDKTVTGDFHKESGETISAQFMQADRVEGYAKGDLFSTVSLDYFEGDYYMRLILPNEGVTVKEVNEALAASGTLQAVVSQAKGYKVHLKMPRFTMENKIDLISTLNALGMKRAFTGEADFSALMDPNSFISKVFQVAKLKVDEEGSEGTAVTVMGFESSPGPIEWEEVDFILDRPFLFQIVEQSTGTVLFMGKVGNPNAE